jgi:hypothetical protein
MATRSTRKERETNNVVVNKEFIICEQNGVWPVFDGLQMFKPTTITVSE